MILKKPAALHRGDTIGLAAPCYRITPEAVDRAERSLRLCGFQVRKAAHLFSDTWGYAGSDTERADDFHELIADPDVKMLLFTGGEVSSDILPLLDFDLIEKNRKIIASYSDGTSILEFIAARCKMITYYGISVHTFEDLRYQNWLSFESVLMKGDTRYEPCSPWTILNGGTASGILTGGYIENFALLLGTPYFTFDPSQEYLLFLEDHEKFHEPAVVARYMARIEQDPLFEHVKGLIFGHYSETHYRQLDEILQRVGKRHGIPVVYTDDFGHGINQEILPIGIPARLDAMAGADKCQFKFLETPVS